MERRKNFRIRCDVSTDIIRRFHHDNNKNDDRAALVVVVNVVIVVVMRFTSRLLGLSALFIFCSSS